jgi:hypothetical protein
MKPLNKSIYILETVNDENIVVYHESSKSTVNQINEYFDFLTQLTAGKKFHIIVDLTQSALPSADVRDLLRSRIYLLEDIILSYNVVVGNNILIKVAVKFLAASLGFQHMTAYKSIIKAKEAIENGI